MSEVAKEIGCARSTIVKYLKEYGIAARPIGFNRYRRPGRGLRYGTKANNKKELAHKREQETVQKMMELRAQGYTYDKIAEIFNTLKIPTKTRRGKWHRKTIHAIIAQFRKGSKIA